MDMVWKSLALSRWYLDLLTSAYLLFQVTLLNYEVKQVLALALTGDPSHYETTSLCWFISVHDQVLVQFPDGQGAESRVRGVRRCQRRAESRDGSEGVMR